MKNKKKILLVILLGAVAFFKTNTECKACDDGRVCFTVSGEPIESKIQEKSGCPSNSSCFMGNNYGADININSVIDDTGGLLANYKIHLNINDFIEYGIEPPSRNNGEYSKEWKEAIKGMGKVINDGKEPNPLQKLILDSMYEANLGNGFTGTMDDFLAQYKNTVLKHGNNKLYNYENEPGATICKTDGTDCHFFTDFSECTAYYGSSYGCYAVQWAQDNCGLEECKGDDEGQIREDTSCMEKYHDWNICCPEIYGSDAPQCNGGGGPSDNPPIDPDTCDPTEIEPITYPPRELKMEEPSGSVGCGTSYTTYSYEYGSTGCKYVNTLITTVRTEEYPEISGLYEAGERFNFSNVVYWHSTKTEMVWDDSPLRNELASAETIKANLKSQRSCLEKNITELEKAIAALKCDPGYTDGNCLNRCPIDISDEEYKICSDDCWVAEDCSKKEQKEKEYREKIESYKKEIDAINPQLEEIQRRIDELNACGTIANSFQETSSSSSGSYSLSGTYLSLDKYTQPINSIKGIAKNSGKLLTASELKKFQFPYFPNNSSFVIPIETKNGTNGSVVTNLYSCPINVRNILICDGDDCGTGSINVIYRPISLTNPFPNIGLNGGYRAMGANWNETYAEAIIKNNRDVSNYEVYSQTPIYTIELDAAKIKEIRKYNKTTSFNDFDMQCTDGYLCKSNFLWGTTENGYNFSDIIVQSESCATADNWNACYGGAD